MKRKSFRRVSICPGPFHDAVRHAFMQNQSPSALWEVAKRYGLTIPEARAIIRWTGDPSKEPMPADYYKLVTA